MWQLEPQPGYEKRLKRFVKKHRREALAVLNNLDTFLKALQAGARVQQVKLGCIHPEPLGVLAIDQKGGGVGLKQTRLYIYPDENSQTLYLLTLGDKQSQKKDIQFCSEWVRNFRRHEHRT